MNASGAIAPSSNPHVSTHKYVFYRIVSVGLYGGVLTFIQCAPTMYCSIETVECCPDEMVKLLNDHMSGL